VRAGSSSGFRPSDEASSSKPHPPSPRSRQLKGRKRCPADLRPSHALRPLVPGRCAQALRDPPPRQSAQGSSARPCRVYPARGCRRASANSPQQRRQQEEEEKEGEGEEAATRCAGLPLSCDPPRARRDALLRQQPQRCCCGMGLARGPPLDADSVSRERGAGAACLAAADLASCSHPRRAPRVPQLDCIEPRTPAQAARASPGQRVRECCWVCTPTLPLTRPILLQLPEKRPPRSPGRARSAPPSSISAATAASSSGGRNGTQTSAPPPPCAEREASIGRYTARWADYLQVN
jgi:hypothetical protein